MSSNVFLLYVLVWTIEILIYMMTCYNSEVFGYVLMSFIIFLFNTVLILPFCKR